MTIAMLRPHLTQTKEQPAHDRELEQELRECMQEMRHNQMLFDLETEPELIEQRVYEYQALQCRYSYLQRKARAEGLRAIL